MYSAQKELIYICSSETHEWFSVLKPNPWLRKPQGQTLGRLGGSTLYWPKRQARKSRISLRAMAIIKHALFCFVFLTVE